MPFRLGDVVLFCLIACILYFAFGGRERNKRAHPSERTSAEPVATVVVENETVQGRSATSTPTATDAVTREPTGKASTVAGKATLFRCVEYRRGDALETEVCRIDREGKAVSPSWVCQQSFEGVIRSLVNAPA